MTNTLTPQKDHNTSHCHCLAHNFPWSYMAFYISQYNTRYSCSFSPQLVTVSWSSYTPSLQKYLNFILITPVYHDHALYDSNVLQTLSATWKTNYTIGVREGATGGGEWGRIIPGQLPILHKSFSLLPPLIIPPQELIEEVTMLPDRLKVSDSSNCATNWTIYT